MSPDTTVTLSTAVQAGIWSALRDLRGVQVALRDRALNPQYVSPVEKDFLITESEVVRESLNLIRAALTVAGFDTSQLPL